LLQSRLAFCLDNQLISFLHRKHGDTNEVLITIDIIKEFKEARINFIQHFSDLARLLGSEIKPAKVDGKTSRPITTTVAKLIDFISDVESPE
jgi:hypothetical protein